MLHQVSGEPPFPRYHGIAIVIETTAGEFVVSEKFCFDTGSSSYEVSDFRFQNRDEKL